MRARPSPMREGEGVPAVAGGKGTPRPMKRVTPDARWYSRGGRGAKQLSVKPNEFLTEVVNMANCIALKTHSASSAAARLGPDSCLWHLGTKIFISP